ncbi:PAS domain S-box protein [Natronomonas marina]|uniref:PAS domain S-box protein n=1 Tax=Natronomonas marina TaxID=2961939 RepID=UPI0020C9F200|nr:PAS domain S-box protein [Natronomonas marina]
MSDHERAARTVLEGTDERVLLSMAGERDRELLAGRLGDRYRVVDGDPGEFDAFDLCIVDGPTYRRVEGSLAELKRETEAYLPVLLLVEDRERAREAEWITETVGGTVDDVLVIPTPKHELDARIEAMLRARRQSRRLALYRRAMDEASIGISITDPDRPDNPLVYVNDGFCRLTGYDREDVLGENCRLLQGPDTEEATVDRLRDAIAAGEPVTVEILNYRADGEPFWNRLTVAPVRDDDGEVSHYLGFQEDVTEQVERKREVRRERERFEALARTATDAILLVDPESTVVYANAAVERVFGHEPAEIEGEPLTKLMPEGHRDSHREGIERYLETGERDIDWNAVRFPGLHADGHEVPLELSFGEFEWDDGRLFAGIIRDVSDRVALEGELREERELLEQIFETSPVGITVVDADGDIVRANEAAEEELGLERSEITSRTFDTPAWETFDADGEPIPAEELPTARVLRTGEPVEDYRHGIRVDGEERWLSINSAPLTDEAGNVESVVNAVRDITDQTERQRELERYETLVEAIDDAAWAYDEDGCLSLVNREFLDNLSVPREAVIGVHLSEFESLFADPGDYEEYRNLVEDLLAGRREEATIDIELTLPDGRFVANLSLASIPGDDGPVGAAAVARDITERVDRERDLKRYETIVQTTPDPIYVLDPEGRFVRVNDAMVEASGYDREDLIGNHASMVADEAMVARVEAIIRDLLAGDRDHATFEGSMTFADDTRREYSTSLSLLREAGEFRGTVVAAHDVTDLRDHKRRLSVLDRVLRHNLRNRMNVVLGYARELADHDDPEVAHLGSAIADSADDLLELSESAREFESVISGTAEATTTMDVVALVETAVAAARSEYPGADISVDCPDAAHARAHETFELAVEELLENAITHCDCEDPTVEVSVTVADDAVLIRVADEGPGLDDVDRRALQSGSESPLEHTQGLGLWLVKWTVESAGGELDIEAREPQGTVVTLSLPRAPP